MEVTASSTLSAVASYLGDVDSEAAGQPDDQEQGITVVCVWGGERQLTSVSSQIESAALLAGIARQTQHIAHGGKAAANQTAARTPEGEAQQPDKAAGPAENPPKDKVDDEAGSHAGGQQGGQEQGGTPSNGGASASSALDPQAKPQAVTQAQSVQGASASAGGGQLYGPSGKPQPEDIAQSRVGDCYFLSSLGALAARQPQTLQKAIQYDPGTQNYTVTLYKETAGKPAPIPITVTPTDIQDDKANHGVDSTRQNPPLWPRVMEAAYADFRTKALGAINIEPPNNRADDIKNARFIASISPSAHTKVMKYELDAIGQGGDPANALYALTGQRGTAVYAYELSDQSQALKRLTQAQQQGRPMILSTNGMKDMPHDGLVQGTWNDDPAKRYGHGYMVKDVAQDAHGDVMLTLVNPWGNNNEEDQVEAKDVKNPSDDPNSPIVQVKLKDIIANGHLADIEMGPASAPPKN